MLDVLLTGYNKSLVRPNCMDVPHPRSIVLVLKIIGPQKTLSHLSQLTYRHNSGIALWPLVSLLPSQLPLTDWLGVEWRCWSILGGAHTLARGCTLAKPCRSKSRWACTWVKSGGESEEGAGIGLDTGGAGETWKKCPGVLLPRWNPWPAHSRPHPSPANQWRQSKMRTCVNKFEGAILGSLNVRCRSPGLVPP